MTRIPPAALASAPRTAPPEPRRSDERGRLLVASNRLPFTLRGTAGARELVASSGGLVAALAPALAARGGTWFGALGEPGERLELPPLGYEVRPIGLTADEVAGYYDGFSNDALWPLLHSLVPSSAFLEESYRAYEAVNERFAKAIAETCRPADLVWIHDYHLFRVPHHLRRLGFRGRIGFFLHVPFPAPDILKALPWAGEILDGLLACDLAGFHVEGYARNFVECARTLRGARGSHRPAWVASASRRVDVGVFPIGIDVDEWETMARKAQGCLPGQFRCLVGVDRLDYTKGIPQRLLAFERFLERHPDQVGRVQLLQLAVPSRGAVKAYRQLKREIDELVGRINGRFATPAWSPVRYMHRSMPPQQLAGVYRDAEVALVTPLRDGMNLVAKEFVACQVADPGVLVLSEMAGAAEDLRDALLVNPHELDALADAIAHALDMPLDERARRVESLRAQVRDHDVHLWADRFLARAAAPSPRQRRSARSEARAGLDPVLGPVVDGRHVTLLLDFDGTLCPIAPHPTQVVVGERTRRLLAGLAARPDTHVAVVSGRALDDLRERLAIPGLVLGGNHGLEMEGPGIEPFRHADLDCFVPQVHALADRLEGLVRDGAWVERKGATLTVHLRPVAPDLRDALVAELREFVVAAGFHARPALAALEARPPLAWDKGLACVHVLRALHGPDWARRAGVVCVGDDATDEDAFARLADLAATFRVGRPGVATAAAHVIRRGLVDAILERVLARPAARLTAAQAG